MAPWLGTRRSMSRTCLKKARTDADTVLGQLHSRLGGLSEAEVESRLKQVGANEIARQKRQSVLMRLLSNVKNPLVLLLLATGSPVLSHRRSAGNRGHLRHGGIGCGVALLPRAARRQCGGEAASHGRQHCDGGARWQGQEVPLKMLVPGDIIRLAAGDMVPADARLLSAKDLFLNQAALTGEALPVERKAATPAADMQKPAGPFEPLLLGLQRGERIRKPPSSFHTGNRTYFGSLAAGNRRSAASRPALTLASTSSPG